MIRRLNNSRGFTMIEIITATMIVVAMTSLAMVRYRSTVSRFRAAEAQQTIMSLWSAQKKYQLRNGSYTSTLSNLDIELRSSEHFNYSVSTSTSALATAVSTSGDQNYTLTVNQDGVISCTPSSGVCGSLGY